MEIKLKLKYTRSQTVKKIHRQASGGSGGQRKRMRNNHWGIWQMVGKDKCSMVKPLSMKRSEY